MPKIGARFARPLVPLYSGTDLYQELKSNQENNIKSIGSFKNSEIAKFAKLFSENPENQDFDRNFPKKVVRSAGFRIGCLCFS